MNNAAKATTAVIVTAGGGMGVYYSTKASSGGSSASVRVERSWDVDLVRLSSKDQWEERNGTYESYLLLVKDFEWLLEGVDGSRKSIEDWCRKQWKEDSVSEREKIKFWCYEKDTVMKRMSKDGVQFKRYIPEFEKVRFEDVLKDLESDEQQKNWLENEKRRVSWSGSYAVKDWCNRQLLLFFEENNSERHTLFRKHCLLP